jgi:hypothetical protein
MEDFVKKRRFDLLYRGRIATACIVYETVDAAVMLVNSAYGFPHSIKLRHIYRVRQAAWKLLCQFFQRIGAASEKGDFRAAVRQSDRRRQSYPRRSAGHNEYAIFDFHLLILQIPTLSCVARQTR